jgi:endonuclease YncB( thermonuclease family)
MIDAVQVFWSPAGVTMPSLGGRSLVDVTDGDTPNIRMPIRMLSVDTPEVTARSDARAAAIDKEFAQLAEWIEQGKAPISAALGKFLVPRLNTGRAGTLQYTQGKAASAFEKDNIAERLKKPNSDKPRNLFIRIGDTPFDDHGRLLAYIAPDYSAAERATMTRKERATFNLDLVESGVAAPFIIYPSVPGELDLPMLLQAAADAISEPRGIWANPETLLPYEYRSMERLHAIAKKIADGTPLKPGEAFSWRERYCVDMRSRTLHGPEDYFDVPPLYRLWLWEKDVAEAVSRLNLTPAARLVGAA